MSILEDGDRIRAGLLAGNLGSTEPTWQSAAISLAEMMGATYPYDHVTPAGWLTFAKKQINNMRNLAMDSEFNQIEVNRLRKEQAGRVMPLIGPLLDAFDGMPNDTICDLENDCPAFYEAMMAIAKAVQND